MNLRSVLTAGIGGLMGMAAVAAPPRMQAIVRTPAGLQLQTVDTPKPAAGEVLIRIYAAGINPADWKRLPEAKTMPDGSVRAAIPGFDVAGVIDSVGPGVVLR